MRFKPSLLLPLLLIAPTLQAAVPKDDLDEQGRGIIQDYGDMTQDEDIEWVWVAPGTKLSSFHYTMAKFDNLSKATDEDMEKAVQTGLPHAFEHNSHAAANAPTLTVDSAIYWSERANRSKIWIPYAGGHLAQAGVGVEVVFKDDSGKIVAKIRQSAREGDKLEEAAEEVVDDIAEYARSH